MVRLKKRFSAAPLLGCEELGFLTGVKDHQVVVLEFSGNGVPEGLEVVG